MIIKSIGLTHFRNFDGKTFELHPALTIIIGENARGKTNLLEGIFLSIYGLGFRESKEDELIQWHENQAIVETVWIEKKENVAFQAVVEKKNEKIEKKFSVNKTKKSHFAYFQYQTRAVLFAPEHIEIITGAPDKRREYFNKLIFAFDLEYKKRLHNYDQALYKRNKILEHHSDEVALRGELSFWDNYLEEQARYITNKRQEYADYLNDHKSVDGKSFRIKYLKNELTRERLQQFFNDEKRMRRTLVGPQKDDFQLYLKNEPSESEGEVKNLHHFGSRSEQRLGIFWLKLNEIRYLEEFFKKKPVLLLDDVFSELDVKNKKVILNLIGQYQTVLTTTEKELLDLTDLPKSTISL